MNASLLEWDSSQEDPPEKLAAKPPGPIYCVIGDTICRVRVWSDAEWAAMAPAERPSPSVFVPGLGWVAAEVGGNPGAP